MKIFSKSTKTDHHVLLQAFIMGLKVEMLVCSSILVTCRSFFNYCYSVDYPESVTNMSYFILAIRRYIYFYPKVLVACDEGLKIHLSDTYVSG